jgi:hypothetical protein
MASVTSSVREAEVGESAAVCATLADAFVSEPVLKFLFPGWWRRDARLRGYFAIELELHLDELRVPDGPRFWPMRRPAAA